LPSKTAPAKRLTATKIATASSTFFYPADEMNIHALQTYSAIAEAQEIMATSHQIVSPQSNAVLIGLVQDSLVGGFMMTSQNVL
jgi:DNA-directed RNA polymerase beta' subunit